MQTGRPAIWQRSLRCFAPDVAFAVRAPRHAASFVGRGRGRDVLAHRLRAFLDSYEVLEFRLLHDAPRGRYLQCRIRYHYRHRRTGMRIDGTMRHVWRVVGGRVERFEIVHDAERMGAYFELTAEPYARV